MNLLSKIIDSLSKKPFLIIFIAVLTTGFTIFLIGKDWRSPLEKCADNIQAEKQSFRTNEKKSIVETKLKEITLKEKSQTQSYLIDYQYCENLNKENPETFKLRYGR